MTPYRVEFTFASEVGHDEANAWLETILENLPEGTVGTLTRESMVLEVEDVTEEHIGEQVRVYVDKKTGTVQGTLTGVFPAGRHRLARTLVVDGVAHTVLFGTVEFLEW